MAAFEVWLQGSSLALDFGPLGAAAGMSRLPSPATGGGSGSGSGVGNIHLTNAVVDAAAKLAGKERPGGGEHVNIKVAVRVRPPSDGYAGEGTLQFDSQTQLTLVNPHGGQRSDFSFDHAYGPEATQAQLYGDLGRQILDCAFEGYNGTIFAYGQTGSGKSHTIMGIASDLGIIPRLGADLFARVEQVQPAGVRARAGASEWELGRDGAAAASAIKALTSALGRAMTIMAAQDRSRNRPRAIGPLLGGELRRRLAPYPHVRPP